MSFWATTEGEKIASSEKIEVEGGSMLPMPAGTAVKAAIEEAKWDTTDGDGTFISLKWTVLAPACFKGRKIFQKLHVQAAKKIGKSNAGLDDDKANKKQNKALRMFAVIDTNAGGKLLASPKAPDDQALQSALVMKSMMLKLDVWVIKTTKEGLPIANPADYARGNWVQAVAPKGDYVEPPKEEQEAIIAQQQEEHRQQLAATPQTGTAPSPTGDTFDDDIPF